MLISVGDSHSAFSFISSSELREINPHTFRYNIVYENLNLKFNFDLDCNWLGPITMHRIGRDGHNFDAYITSDDDFLFLFFGEIDVRLHIGKQISLGRREEEVIDTLVVNYINSIANNEKKNQFIVSSVICPAYSSSGIGDHTGSDEERSKWTKSLNRKLKDYASFKGIKIFNPYEYYQTDSGNLNNELSDCINHTHVGNPKYVINYLIKYLLSLETANETSCIRTG